MWYGYFNLYRRRLTIFIKSGKNLAFQIDLKKKNYYY
jgi:hypothetical protein